MLPKYAIVVDTDIVRAASREDSPNLSTNILKAFRDSVHVVALSKPLREEWLKIRSSAAGGWKFYISQYAFMWFTEMEIRNRVKFYDLEQTLGAQILGGFASAVCKREVEKDLHVVLTALAADNRLISNDCRMRTCLCKASQWAPSLHKLIWPFPLREVPQWLLEGAPVKQPFLICDEK